MADEPAIDKCPLCGREEYLVETDLKKKDAGGQLRRVWRCKDVKECGYQEGR